MSLEGEILALEAWDPDCQLACDRWPRARRRRLRQCTIESLAQFLRLGVDGLFTESWNVTVMHVGDVFTCKL